MLVQYKMFLSEFHTDIKLRKEEKSETIVNGMKRVYKSR